MANETKITFPATQERNELIFTAVLSSLDSVNEARRAIHYPGLQVHHAEAAGTPGEYSTGTDKLTLANLDRVRIDTGDGQEYYFRRVNVASPAAPLPAAPANETPVAKAEREAREAAFRASAWQPIDRDGKALTDAQGKSDLRFYFPGYRGGFHFPPSEEQKALQAVQFGGEVNRQVMAAPAFIDDTFRIVSPDTVSHVIIGGYSMGAQAAAAGDAYLTLKGVKHTTIVEEPYGISGAAKKMLEALQRPETLLAQVIAARLPGGKLPAEGTGEAGKHFNAIRSYRAVAIGEDGIARNVSMLAQFPVGQNRLNNLMTGLQGGILTNPQWDITLANDPMRGFDKKHDPIYVAYQLMKLNEAERKRTHPELTSLREAMYSPEGAPQEKKAEAAPLPPPPASAIIVGPAGQKR